jgi:hypothetical protein
MSFIFLKITNFNYFFLQNEKKNEYTFNIHLYLLFQLTMLLKLLCCYNAPPTNLL